MALPFGCDSSYGGAEAPASDAGDASTSASDAAVEDQVAPLDGGDAGAAACDPTKPFGTPREVMGLATPQHEGSARLSPDQLTVVYHAERGDASGENDLFTATRTDPNGAFSGETRLSMLATANSENHPSMSPDGLTLLFARYVANEWSLHRSTRATTSALFETAMPVGSPINVAGSELQPYLLADALYFTSSVPDAGVLRTLNRASRNGASFDAPVAMPELASSSSDFNPTVTPDERTIYFSSNRPAAGAKGQYDIYFATRASKDVPFSAIKPVEELNTTANEYPDWISPDGCRLYFTSDRVRGDGSGDVFVAERGR